MYKNWIAFYSKSGREINNIRKTINRNPDLIVTNRGDLEGTNKELVKDCGDVIYQIPNKPILNNYLDVIEDCSDLFDNCIITLHGYLRIIPKELCDQFDIYNLHPGLINEFPELRGKDPQLKAYKGNYEYSGNVIFKVDENIDTGNIICYNKTCIKDLSLEEITGVLHDKAGELWLGFLKDKIY